MLGAAVGPRKQSDHSDQALTVLDVNVLNAFEKVKSDNGSDIVVELIDLYLDGTPQRIQEMHKAVATQDFVSLRRIAHTLKGSSSTLGLHGFANICQQLEDIITPFRDTVLETFESRFAEAKDALIAERRRRMAE